jgi:hypothetical protein
MLIQVLTWAAWIAKIYIGIVIVGSLFALTWAGCALTYVAISEWWRRRGSKGR